jgi:aspartyl/asparaginyl beta-hydroxylase (cupin superfamily)
VIALTQIGTYAFRQGDFEAAHVAFKRATEADGSDPRQWVNLAMACQPLADHAGEEQALFKALSLDANDLSALLHRGAMYERRGERHRAAAAFGAASTVAPPMQRLRPEYVPAVTHAMKYREQYQADLGAFLESELQPVLQACDRRDTQRFQLSLDMLTGRKQRFDQQPMRYYVPDLPVTEFFDRAQFPWMEEMESHTDAITEELMAVLREDQGIAPYIGYGQDEPLAQWAELNHSPRWSAYHLWAAGAPVPEHAARCPRTIEAWRKVPSPDQPGRTPVLMFSLLKPRTNIPAHVGASNARLVCHLPLIVPDGCRFRVGNSVREWQRGRLWAFNDTIEHEAWNDSDRLRVVLIFDVWHPSLNESEKRLITAMNQALNRFGQPSDAYDV